METKKLDLALSVALKAAAKGREILLHYYGHLTKVQEKHLAGLVTEADVESEKAIVKILKEHDPSCTILGEEATAEASQDSTSNTENRWLIDPLDGTTNFVHQFPIFCISIGWQYQGEMAVGVVDVPVLDQSFQAQRGRGAEMNGRKLQVSQRTGLKNALVGTGFYSQKKEILAEQIAIFTQIVAQARGVRRPGAAAYDLCLVGQGVFDGFWEQNLQPWDVAAGALIVQEAGGMITGFQGQAFHPEISSLVAGNPSIHRDILDCIQSTQQK
jgi:myo-inositol-1(or 4)-monophosphatase